MKAILYVSHARLPPTGCDRAVAELIEAARRRNSALELTGAVIFTGTHFAQLIEGPSAHVDAVMASIRRDQRHCDLRCFEEEPIQARRFGDWSLAFSGTSSFVDRQVRPLFSLPRHDLQHARSDLLELLVTFVT